MRRTLLILVMLIVLVASVCCSLQAAIGIGVELIGAIPFLTVNSNWGSIGGEVGMGLSSQGFLGMNLSYLWYCVNGKYYIPIPALGAGQYLYLGGGIIGLYVSYSGSYLGYEVAASGSATGGLVLGGLEYSLASVGLPLVIFGGADYVSITKIEVTISGTTVELPVDMSTFGTHLGIRWVF